LNNKANEILNTRVFSVYFNRSEQQYYIKTINDNKNGRNLLYMKIEKPYIVLEKHFFFLGDCLISAELHETTKSLLIELYYPNGTENEKYEFSIKDTPVTIGRIKCSVRINSTICSKKQATLEHNEGNWYIYDGHGTKKSTNGTWLLLDRKFQLETDCYLKLGSNVFSINIV